MWVSRECKKDKLILTIGYCLGKFECTTSQLALLECPTQPTCKIQINQHQNRPRYFQFVHPYALDPPIFLFE